MKLYLGADHAGFALKEALRTALVAQGHDVTDCGAFSADAVGYPDVAHNVAGNLATDAQALGLLICGSGNGVCITANKHPGVRAGLAWNAEVAALLRQHNNANCLCLPARFVTQDEALACLEAFLKANFEGGRHARRVDKIEPHC